MKKIVAGILAFSLIIGGIYFVAPEASEAKAETPEETAEQIAYVTEAYTGDEDVQKVQTYLENKDVVEARETTHDGWLFAGWFTDEYCTTPVTAVSEDITTYHAKFVDPGVMNVKLQITKDTTTESETTNMRLITSVDSLDYAEVGFDVYYDAAIGTEEPTKNIPIYTVYERIVASSESGVEYNYSPKVVDTDSEYFATATLIDIAKDNFDKAFHIKPYWITLSGAKVYGTSRYVTIADDALSTTTVNVPVKIAESDAYTVAEDADASVAYHDGTYAHFRMSATAASKSLTKFNVSNGTETAVAYYRNLETTYNGTTATADTSWYDTDTSATEFVIATDADLYGFAQITSTSFNKMTVYLVADIIANKGEASTTKWVATADGGTSFNWTPIMASGSFGGTFDGQMHSISGICVQEEPSNGFVGLFGYVNANGTIKNLELKNSYFNASTQMVGSITAKGTGTYSNIKSSAYINSSVAAGGIIGQVNHGTNTQISNCWFGGTITTSAQYVGGIVGSSVRTGMTISDCLNTGSIITTHKTPFMGGIFGAHGNSNLSAVVENCLNSSTLDASAATGTGYIGQIYGGNNKAATMTITNSYGTVECGANLVGSNKNTITYTEGSPNVTQITEYGITGISAYHSTNLDFTNTWAAQDGTLPILKMFATAELNTSGIIKADTTWYNEGIAITDESGEITGYTYTIDTAAELYGLGVLVNNSTDDFLGDTIVITEDIDLNEDWDNTFDISTNSPKGQTEATNRWVPIGCAAYPFRGVFGAATVDPIRTISGLYIEKRVDDGYDLGLFGYASDCTIQNVSLVDSYIYNSVRNAATGTGSIVGRGDGNIVNVYSECDIYGVNAMQLAGMIGMIEDGTNDDTGVTILNCWYDGNIVVRSNAANIHNMAGLIGYAKFGTISLTNILFTGILNYKTGYESDTAITINGPYIGGLIARDNSVTNITIENCLSAGEIQVTAVENVTFKQIASVVGRHNTSGTLNVTNGYTTISTNELPIVLNTANTMVDKGIEVVTNWDSSVNGLDTEYWQLDSTATIPVLKTLVDYTNDKWAVLP